jgi:hypothetical protein
MTSVLLQRKNDNWLEMFVCRLPPLPYHVQLPARSWTENPAKKKEHDIE